VHPRRFWASYEAIWRVVTERGVWRYGAIKLTDVACRLLHCWADIYRRTWADVDIQMIRVAWMGVFKQLSLQHAPYADRFITSVRDQVICCADGNVTAHKTQRNIQDFSQEFLCVFLVSLQSRYMFSILSLTAQQYYVEEVDCYIFLPFPVSFIPLRSKYFPEKEFSNLAIYILPPKQRSTFHTNQRKQWYYCFIYIYIYIYTAFWKVEQRTVLDVVYAWWHRSVSSFRNTQTCYKRKNTFQNTFCESTWEAMYSSFTDKVEHNCHFPPPVWHFMTRVSRCESSTDQ
jgi:hypothetical protein